MPPVVSTIDQITLYAAELLALAEAATALTPAGTPERSYVSPSGPPWDCEQLTVEHLSLGDHPFPRTATLDSGQMTAAVNLVGYRIVIVRCVPVMDEDGDPPDPVDEAVAADQLHQDVFSIWTRIRSTYREGDLFGGNCDHLFLDGAVPVDTSGGFSGWQIDLRAEIAGFANSGT